MPESVSAEVADKPARPAAKTPEQLAKMLAKACRGISKVLVIVLLDIEEKYIMTEAEARAIADPAARILNRVKALRKPIRWITGNSDELDLIIALSRYSIRLADPIGSKIDLARSRRQLVKSMETKTSGTTQQTSTPQPARDNGGPTPGPAAGPGSNGSIPYAGLSPEPLEPGAFIIPGVGWGFSQ